MKENQIIFNKLSEYQYKMESGLEYNNEFTFLIAILLSAQSKDAFINTQTKEFFEIADTSEKMADLEVYQIANYIKKIGLWRTKAENIHKLARQINELKKIENQENWFQEIENNWNGDPSFLKIYGPVISSEGIPSFKAGLVDLAGIGTKSANVFLNVIYNAPTLPVDTHVKRLCNRIGISESSNVKKIEIDLEEFTPEEYKNKAAHLLVWHGRNVCKAIKPKCEECKIKDFCKYYKKNSNS